MPTPTPASRKGLILEAEPEGVGDVNGVAGPSSSDDRIIGLDVGGRMFYTHLSTLTNGSPYFEARFGGAFNPGGSHRDERGRDVYFVDGDGDLFRYILEYLRRGVRSWPTFRQDPVTWERLRSEAEYFGLDSMAEALCVVYSCSPDMQEGKGVLYWLGTKKGTAAYSNPFDTKAVTLGGTFKENMESEWDEAQRAFVQYRPKTSRGDETSSDVLYCDYSSNRSSLVITITDVSVRPTHYSLRYGQCYGMDTWNFEASVDRLSWDTLHEARGDPHLRWPSQEKRNQLENMLKGVNNKEEKTEIATSFIEHEGRHTWTLDPAPAKFYRHFRLVGVGPEYFAEIGKDDENEDEDDSINCLCMHGVGFELFGDVRE